MLLGVRACELRALRYLDKVMLEGVVDGPAYRAQNAKFTFTTDDATQPLLPAEDEQAWQRFAADCVECGACTNICPTCHCFYLYDQALGAEGFERVRNWYSCLFGSYHRMAGGVNMKLTPRPKLRARLANRVLHKFVYSPRLRPCRTARPIRRRLFCPLRWRQSWAVRTCWLASVALS